MHCIKKKKISAYLSVVIKHTKNSTEKEISLTITRSLFSDMANLGAVANEE